MKKNKEKIYDAFSSEKRYTDWRDNDKRKQERIHLIDILDKRSYNKDDKEQSKNAIKEFLTALKEAKYEKEYHINNSFFTPHTGYVFYLINVKAAFMRNDYYKVCGELVSLVWGYDDIFQPRIKDNTIALIEKYI